MWGTGRFAAQCGSPRSSGTRLLGQFLRRQHLLVQAQGRAEVSKQSQPIGIWRLLVHPSCRLSISVCTNQLSHHLAFYTSQLLHQLALTTLGKTKFYINELFPHISFTPRISFTPICFYTSSLLHQLAFAQTSSSINELSHYVPLINVTFSSTAVACRHSHKLAVAPTSCYTN